MRAPSNSDHAASDFEKIDLSVTLGKEDQVWISAVSRLGVVHGVPVRELPGGSLKELLEHTQIFRQAIAIGLNDPQLAFKTGNLLHNLVFGIPDVRALFQRTRGAASDHDRPLLIRILATPRAIASLPWELILDPEGPLDPQDESSLYLTLAPDTHIVRLARVRTYPVETPLIPPPLKMLLILSSPVGAKDDSGDLQFDVYEEKRSLFTELTPLIETGLLQVDVEDRPTMENLRARIASRERGYHIIHYIGHATSEGLLLEGALERVVRTSPEKFNALLRGCPEIALVFFAGCETAQNPQDDLEEVWPGMLSVAERCVRDACQLVVGMQSKLPFRTERLFSGFFYKALASGRSVADSITLARAAVRDDEQAGGGLLNWAVPCLFVGGESAHRLVDVNVPARPVQLRKREALRLDVFEEDREFFLQYERLRPAIDFLRGLKRYRVLWITGLSNSDRRQLINHALDEVEEITYLLDVPMDRLLKERDPVKEMCKLVTERLTSRDGKSRDPKRGWKSAAWWERIIEEIVTQNYAIVLVGVDLIKDYEKNGLAKAIRRLVKRQARARLVLLSVEQADALLIDEDEDLGERLIRKVLPIKLAKPTWEEVFLWIRQNFPAFSQENEKPTLLKFFSVIDYDLELWTRLAEEKARTPGRKLSEIVAEMVTPIEEGRRHAKATLVIEMSGAMPTSRANEKTSRANEKEATGLRVACAGPEYEGRQKEFAMAITALAAKHDVGGRLAETTGGSTSGLLGSLLPIPSPFSGKNEASTIEIAKWLEQAVEAEADIVLADFGSKVPSMIMSNAIETLEKMNVLVLGAGSNSKRPMYPGWNPNVLAVGPLKEDGKIDRSVLWDSERRKPDLFALGTVQNEEYLKDVVHHPDRYGAALAAVHLLVAAVLVWATDRTLTAAQVREILISTADPILRRGSKSHVPPRRVNLEAALKQVRENLIKGVLSKGSLEIEELIAACGMRPTTTIRLVDEMAQKFILRKTKGTQGEVYELTADTMKV